jgi:hypothetical protein
LYTTIPSPKLKWIEFGFCRTVGAIKHTTENHKSHGCYSTILALPPA